MQISAKIWSDFAATIPLIRSFSLGDNLPPQYPIFAGPPIRYHFVFFAIVGILEKIGIPLDWALNSLSFLSFFLLTSLIYILGKTLFKSKAVGVISVILFLFNGSFGFLEFFKKHPFTLNIPSGILSNTEFSSFGPYDGKIVSAFWSLNIYTNQRHLALAYAAFIFLVLLIYKASKNPKKLTWIGTIIFGLAIGLFPFVHTAVFGMMGITLIVYIFLYPDLRKKILVAGLIALLFAIPQFSYMGNPQMQVKFFNPGFLIDNLTAPNFLKYWFFNLGFTVVLAPIGFLLAKKTIRKIIFPFLALFVIGNLFQFTPEIAANHKFFNLFLIGANFFVAFFLTILWKKKILGKVFSILLLIPLILTGFIDLFPILNDRHIELSDIAINKTAAFINQSTPKNSTFLNAMFLYDPASLAGRKIFLGWPYFSWSAGYDTNYRFEKMKAVLGATSHDSLCQQLVTEGIDYIEIQEPSRLENIAVNFPLFQKKMRQIFFDSEQNITIYDVRASCSKFKNS